jgi:hypothetical protein
MDWYKITNPDSEVDESSGHSEGTREELDEQRKLLMRKHRVNGIRCFVLWRDDGDFLIEIERWSAPSE